jgi:hypothetical protein
MKIEKQMHRALVYVNLSVIHHFLQTSISSTYFNFPPVFSKVNKEKCNLTHQSLRAHEFNSIYTMYQKLQVDILNIRHFLDFFFPIFYKILSKFLRVLIISLAIYS